MKRLPLFILIITLPLLFAFAPRMHHFAPTTIPVVSVPGEISITSPHPNPFTNFTQLTLATSRTQLIDVEVINLTGQRILFLYEGMLQAGEPRSIRFEARNLPSGVYFFLIRGENLLTTRKVVLAR